MSETESGRVSLEVVAMDRDFGDCTIELARTVVLLSFDL